MFFKDTTQLTTQHRSSSQGSLGSATPTIPPRPSPRPWSMIHVDNTNISGQISASDLRGSPRTESGFGIYCFAFFYFGLLKSYCIMMESCFHLWSSLHRNKRLLFITSAFFVAACYNFLNVYLDEYIDQRWIKGHILFCVNQSVSTFWRPKVSLMINLFFPIN